MVRHSTDLHDRDYETLIDHKLTEISRPLVAMCVCVCWCVCVCVRRGVRLKENVGSRYPPVSAMPDQESADVSELSNGEICCQTCLLPFLGKAEGNRD